MSRKMPLSRRIFVTCVEERATVPTSPKDRKALKSAGLFHATGLTYKKRLDRQIVIGRQLRETEMGCWNQRDGSVTIVTPGGEIWCGSAGSMIPPDGDAFLRLLDRLEIHSKNGVVHPVEFLDSRDVLRRMGDPDAGAEPTIHALHGGQALCDFSSKVPCDWPPGHKWAHAGHGTVNCPECKKVWANRPNDFQP